MQALQPLEAGEEIFLRLSPEDCTCDECQSRYNGHVLSIENFQHKILFNQGLMKFHFFRESPDRSSDDGEEDMILHR